MAAGTIYWDGSTSVDCTAAANWTVGTATAHTIPEVGDEVIFDARPGQNFAPTGTCAVGDAGGIDFDLMHFKKGYTTGIGLTNLPYHTSAQKIVIEGTGNYYIEVSETAVGADQVIPVVIINNKDANVWLTSNQNDGSWCCEFTDVRVLAGTVVIGYNGTAAVDTAVENLYLMPANGISSNVSVTMHEDCIRSKATAYQVDIFMDGGTLAMDSAAGTIEIFGGALTYGFDGTAETGLDIAKLVMHGGSFTWQPDDEAAFIEKVYLYGGTFDASGTVNNDKGKVLGNAAGDNIYVFAGAVMKLDNNMGNITLDGDARFWNHGGTVTWDKGTSMTWAYNIPTQ